MSIEERDIEENCREIVCNFMPESQKDRITNFSYAIEKVDVKEEPLEIKEVKYRTGDECDVPNISNCDNSCKNEAQNLVVHSDTCENVCSKCQILTYVMRNSVQNGSTDEVWNTLPKNLVEIRKSNCTEGIFALQTLPKGIQFGPCRGLEHTRNAKMCTWKLKGGKFVHVQESMKYSNWMGHFNCAKAPGEQNLAVCQYEGHLYYRSKCQIAKGEELLLYYGEGGANNFDAASESHYNPPVENYIDNMYGCTYCSLGFCSVNHIVRHRSKCPRAATSNPIEEIVQCTFCKMYLHENEYLEYHMDRCRDVNSRKTAPMVIAQSVEEVSRKIENSDNMQPIERKLSKLKKCKRNYATNKKKQKFFACDSCEHKFNRKSSLQQHLMAIHSTTNDKMYKCTHCEYETNIRGSLHNHMITHKTGEKTRVCTKCGFRTNYESCLRRHIANLHPSIQKFKCPHCPFGTNSAKSFNLHLNVHNGLESYACKTCGNRYHRKSSLVEHNLTHGDKKLFSCEYCHYESNYKRFLKRHVKKKHAAEQKASVNINN